MHWSLLFTPPLAGAQNMALDEALLERARTTGEAVFRVYTWTSPTLSFGDENRTDNLFAAFVQDEIELVDERWLLTLGAKVENNDYSGWEFQPNARLWFRPSPHQAWWASVSRAVRTPSQVEDDVSLLAGFIPGAPNQAPTLFGNSDLDSEKLTAYEIGYRVQPSEKVSLDIATFYNDYEDLIVFEQGAPFFSGGDLIIPLTAENATQGTSYGAELSAAWQWREDTRLIAGYSFIQLDVDDTADAIGLARQPRRRIGGEPHDLQQRTRARLRYRRTLGDDEVAVLHLLAELPRCAGFLRALQHEPTRATAADRGAIARYGQRARRVTLQRGGQAGQLGGGPGEVLRWAERTEAPQVTPQ
jgi:outer membrane receptor protein involved in Fe transport